MRNRTESRVSWKCMCLKITRSAAWSSSFSSWGLDGQLSTTLAPDRATLSSFFYDRQSAPLHSRWLICCLFPHLRYLPKDIQWVSPFTWPFITLGYPLATGTRRAKRREWAHYALCLSLREWGDARGKTKVSPFSPPNYNQTTVDGLWVWPLLHCLSVQSCPVLNGSWHEV